ncbi:unnamed protein product [Pylaiella littoralis]
MESRSPVAGLVFYGRQQHRYLAKRAPHQDGRRQPQHKTGPNMPISFHHVDELSFPPSNLICIDRKSVLASTTVSFASEHPAQAAFLQDIVAGLVPAGSRPCTAETFLPCTATEAGAGEGAEATTVPKLPPRRVALCALPEACSRHNSPAQPHAIADSVRSISGSGSVAVVMCLEHPSYAFAAGCAVARAFPLYSTTSRKRPGAGAASVPAPPPSRNVRVYLRVPHDAWGTVQADLTAVAEGIQLAARLVDTPPNVLSTTAFVEEAMAVARGLPPSTVQVKVIRGEELKDQGFGGLYGVGKAAVEPPALVVLSYVAAGSAEGGGGGANIPGAAGSVCFVGKGIIYDTGGLSIKTKTGMPGMKRDMGGAAAILGAFQAAVKAQIAAEAAGGDAGQARPLHALLCLAENSVAANATRPDDVHTLYSGRTVEINNTDAEGRLVLADGVAFAAHHLNPSVIIDMATLTGAQGVATGRRHASVLSNDEGLEKAAVECGRASGDLAHAVVFCPEFFSEEFRSSVADMKNSVADRSNAQVSCAGQFIANHIEQFVTGPAAGGGRWLHIDMASPAHQGERRVTTGYGVALLFNLLRVLNRETG